MQDLCRTSQALRRASMAKERLLVFEVFKVVVAEIRWSAETRDGTEVITAPMAECNTTSVIIGVTGQVVFRVAVAANVEIRA